MKHPARSGAPNGTRVFLLAFSRAEPRCAYLRGKVPGCQRPPKAGRSPRGQTLLGSRQKASRPAKAVVVVAAATTAPPSLFLSLVSRDALLSEGGSSLPTRSPPAPLRLPPPPPPPPATQQLLSQKGSGRRVRTAGPSAAGSPPWCQAAVLLTQPTWDHSKAGGSERQARLLGCLHPCRLLLVRRTAAALVSEPLLASDRQPASFHTAKVSRTQRSPGARGTGAGLRWGGQRLAEQRSRRSEGGDARELATAHTRTGQAGLGGKRGGRSPLPNSRSWSLSPRWLDDNRVARPPVAAFPANRFPTLGRRPSAS